MSLPLPKKTEQDRLIDFLLPGKTTLLFYFLIASLVLILLDITPFWQYFTSYILGSSEVPTADYSSISDPLLTFINKFDAPILILLWGFFGCLVFSVILLGQKTYRTLKQESEQSHYLTGGVRSNHTFWHSALRSDAVFLLLGITWVSYMVLYIDGILPWVSHLLFSGLYGSLGDWYKVLASLIVNTLVFWIYIKLLQLMLGSWREIRPNS